MNSPTRQQIRLGLIGDNIAASQAPFLHETGGRLHGLNISYERLVPKEKGLDAAALLLWAQGEGFAGLNITYPYKELIAGLVEINDPLVKTMGAVNTVIFDGDAAGGFNTDYSGFVRAWSLAFSPMTPGRVLLIGAGGVGRAVAFGLVTLEAREVRIFDKELSKTTSLVDTLRSIAPELAIVASSDAATLAEGANGVINCTPVGMVGYEGTPISRDVLPGDGWAFDAIYTPLETQFMKDALSSGLKVLSGYELFFYQGVDAFKLFTGIDIDQKQLRQALVNPTSPR